MGFQPARYQPNIQAFTSTGTWTKPTLYNYQWAEIILLGTGGGGGGGAWSSAEPAGGGGGGGGGCRIRVVVPLSVLPSSATVTIGALGAAGTANTTLENAAGHNGGTGGATKFGSLFSAPGGGNGAGGPWNSTAVAGVQTSIFNANGGIFTGPNTANAGGGSVSTTTVSPLGHIPGSSGPFSAAQGAGGEGIDGGSNGSGADLGGISFVTNTTSYGNSFVGAGGSGGNAGASSGGAGTTPFSLGYAIITCW